MKKFSEWDNKKIDYWFNIFGIISVTFCFLVVNTVYLLVGLSVWYRNMIVGRGIIETNIANLSTFLLSIPIDIDFSTLTEILILITAGVCGLELSLTNIRNLQLDKGFGVDIPNKKKILIMYMNLCWIITTILFLFIYYGLGVKLINEGLRIELPMTQIQIGLGVTSGVSFMGGIVKEITKNLPKFKKLDDIIDNDNKEEKENNNEDK